MIVTVTANTAIDHLISVDGSWRQDVVLATESQLFAAGKGINVSRAIEALGGQSTALCMVGRDAESIFNRLKSSRATHYDFILVAGATRFNVTIRNSGTGATSHIRTEGYRAPEASLMQLHHNLTACIRPGDIVVISGSLPKSADAATYHNLITACHTRTARVVFDASGAEFAKGLDANPFLIKPNLQELSELIGSNIPNEDNAIAEVITSDAFKNIETVVVSRGSKGAIAHCRRQGVTLTAWLDKDINPSVVNVVGSGDAMVGGIAMALTERLPLEQLVKKGVASGAANVLSAVPGWCDPAQMEALMASVRTRCLS